MCGITGILRPDASRRALDGDIRRMTGVLRHRGPDGEGFWIDAARGIALGHRRLAVIDPSPTGAQPMVSPDRRLVLTYNGELYNFRELRRELEAGGERFRGPSDTEVLLAACRCWGVRRTLERANGMFALGLWDGAAQCLVLARDHLGIKPLFWSDLGGRIVFASELKAIRAGLPDAAFEIDRGALAAYCRLGYVPAPYTIWRGVYRLPPGTMLTISAGGQRQEERFFDIRAVAAAGARAPAAVPEGEAADALEALLSDAVGKQMVADVPLGVLLSGGVDSSLVAALMQQHASRPIKTFTIGFREAAFDEAPYAARVARHLGAEHTELYLDLVQLRDIVPRLPEFFDEPFADASAIPTFLVARLARGKVTVALAGDGGDELFAGYDRYFATEAIARRLRGVPSALRRAAAAALRSMPSTSWGRLGPRLGADRVGKLAALLGDGDAYRLLTARWLDAPVRDAVELPLPCSAADLQRLPPGIARMQLCDFLTYLPEGILTKADRTSMAVSLEIRVPLLDPRIVEHVWSLPEALKVRDGRGKFLLRQVLHRHVPAELVERPKMGFTVPLGQWLRHELRDWSEDLLSETALAGSGVLDIPPIRRRWCQHITGAREADHALWPILMFQSWHRSLRPATVADESATVAPFAAG
jgi:asparagine synthase (glutamine-hydrolysing)